MRYEEWRKLDKKNKMLFSCTQSRMMYTPGYDYSITQMIMKMELEISEIGNCSAKQLNVLELRGKLKRIDRIEKQIDEIKQFYRENKNEV